VTILVGLKGTGLLNSLPVTPSNTINGFSVIPIASVQCGSTGNRFDWRNEFASVGDEEGEK
jgi:hypothetical protein